MKKVIFRVLSFVLIMLIVTSCSKSDDGSTPSRPVITTPPVDDSGLKPEDPPELVEPKNTVGTLLDRNGKVMRGVPMIITQIHDGKGEDKGVPFAENVEHWEIFKDTYKMNTVRLYWSDLWKSIRGAKENEYWNVDEALPHIDKCVKNAVATGMNIIINYHVTGENMEFVDDNDVKQPIDYNRNHKERVDFWKKIAQKYKDNNLVYFELSNEPVFWDNHYLAKDFKDNLMQIYKMVRKEAPNRQILLFSFNGTHYDLKKVIEDYSSEIDWNRTSVAFHGYEDTTSTKISELMKTYRIICTEWDYDTTTYKYVVRIDNERLTAQTMERLGISWVDWFNQEDVTSLKRLDNVLLPDAKAKGYWWGN